MKRGTLIAGGVILIIVVSVIWVYLMFFGTPKESTDIFANLGFGGETTVREHIPNLPPEEIEANIDVASAALAQLTTRPVAGYGFIQNATSTSLRYAERGVGHIYEIDLINGNEKRVLGKTLTGITEAVFSPDGKAVVLVAHDSTGTSAHLEIVDANDASTKHTLPVDIENIEFTSNNILRYTRVNTDGMTGYSYNVATMTTNELFTIPFTDAHIIWGDGRTFVYNSPAPFHKGGLYEIGGGLSRIGETAYGLSAFKAPFTNRYIITQFDMKNNLLASSLSDSVGNNDQYLPTIALPEKCVFNPTDHSIIWCGSPIGILDRTYQNDWYKGTITSNDYLWSIDVEEDSAATEVDFLKQTGRIVDVQGLQIDETGSYLLFKNKLDNTLWFYNTTFGVTEEIEEEESIEAEEI